MKLLKEDFQRIKSQIYEEQLPGGAQFDEIRRQLTKLGMPMKKANAHITGFMMSADNRTYDKILTLDPREAAKIIVAGSEEGDRRRAAGEMYGSDTYKLPEEPREKTYREQLDDDPALDAFIGGMDEGEEDHPAQEYREEEADRRWQRDNQGELDWDEMEEPYDMDESANQVALKEWWNVTKDKMTLNEVSLGDMYREMGTWFALDPRLQKIADESRIDDTNSEDLQYLVNGWQDGMYDEDPEVLMSELENIIEGL